MSIQRRKGPEVPKLKHLDSVSVRGRLERCLKWMRDQMISGIPGGWKDTAPLPVIVGTAADADAGNRDVASWMAADAQIVVLDDVPVGLGNANAKGTSTKVANAAHVHKRDVRVKRATVDVGTRNALNFSADFTVADNAGTDSVDVSLNVSPEEALIVALMAL